MKNLKSTITFEEWKEILKKFQKESIEINNQGIDNFNKKHYND